MSVATKAHLRKAKALAAQTYGPHGSVGKPYELMSLDQWMQNAREDYKVLFLATPLLNSDDKFIEKGVRQHFEQFKELTDVIGVRLDRLQTEASIMQIVHERLMVAHARLFLEMEGTAA